LLALPAYEHLDRPACVGLDVINGIVEAPQALVSATGRKGFDVIQREVAQQQTFRLDLHNGSLTSVQ
jgi:hypothetical protein